MISGAKKNGCFYRSRNLFFCSILFVFSIAKSAALGSIGLERVRYVLRVSYDVKRIEDALKLAEKLNGKKLSKKELGSLLVYAGQVSTGEVINTLLVAGADIYTAREGKEHPQVRDSEGQTVQNAVIDRYSKVYREPNLNDIEVRVGALKAVVEAGGFDSLNNHLRVFFNGTRSIIKKGQQERDACVGLCVSEIFNRSKSDLQDKYGKFAEELINGYASSSSVDPKEVVPHSK